MDKLLEVIPLFYYDLAAVIVFFFLFIHFRTSSERNKIRALYIMCIINFIFYIINDYYFYIEGSEILTLLPLQLCNIAVFLIPVAVISKKQLLLDFVFYICTPGALAALLVPTSDYIGRPYSMMTISFFIFHFMIVAVPLLLAGWGMYKPAPTIYKAIRLSITILILAGAMHILNLAFERFLNVGSDYFFTIIKYSAPSNPVFALLSKIIPYDFFYLIPALVILYFYMGIVFAVTRLKSKYIRIESTESGSRAL